jgi:hypothetical protein
MLPPGVTDYVNSSWEIQQNPFCGDALKISLDYIAGIFD